MPEPPLFTKSYELANWLLPATMKFPRTYRAALGGRLQQSAVDLLVEMTAARYGADRLGSLGRADGLLEVMRVLLRLAKDQRVLAEKPYLEAAGRLDELGRMIGGWTKQLKGAR